MLVARLPMAEIVTPLAVTEPPRIAAESPSSEDPSLERLTPLAVLPAVKEPLTASVASPLASGPTRITPTVAAKDMVPLSAAVAVIKDTSRASLACTETLPGVVTVSPTISAVLALLSTTTFALAPKPPAPPTDAAPTVVSIETLSVAVTLTSATVDAIVAVVL